jgi:glycosyltransferase involved in cell wall biosynthesis
MREARSERAKVAHVTTVDLSLRYLLLNQLCALRAAGYEVAGISAGGPHVPALEQAGIRHIAVPMTRRMTPLADLVALVRLYRIMRRERFTIVHTHTPKPNLIGQLAARAAGVPVVLSTVHGYYFHDGMAALPRRLLVALEKIAARCSHLILSQSREDVETALRERIAGPDRIELLGNGIDLRRFDRAALSGEALRAVRRELGLPEGAPVIGFVGRLVAEKGLGELMEAAPAVLRRFPGARFLVVGPREPDKADSVGPEAAARLGVDHAFVFAGLRDDMPAMYALMDVFALPSHREGFPRSPMEASAMGVPCVVTDIRGCREAVDEGVNGLFVPPRDAAALADAILAILGDRERAAALARGGLRLARERFDEQRVFAHVVDAYERLRARRAAARP